MGHDLWQCSPLYVATIITKTDRTYRDSWAFDFCAQSLQWNQKFGICSSFWYLRESAALSLRSRSHTRDWNSEEKRVLSLLSSPQIEKVTFIRPLIGRNKAASLCVRKKLINLYRAFSVKFFELDAFGRPMAIKGAQTKMFIASLQSIESIRLNRVWNALEFRVDGI